MTDKSTRFDDPLAYFVLALLALCFGSALFFQNFALQSFNTVGVAAWRFIGAAVVLVVIAFVGGYGLVRTPQLWKWSVLNGLVGFVAPFYLMIWAQQHIATSLIGVMFACIPLLMLAMSRLFLSVAISRRKVIGLLIGLAGMAILIGPDRASIDTEFAFLAKLAAVLAMVIIAVSGIVIRLMPPCQPVSAVASAALIAGVVSVPFALLNLPAAPPSGSSILGLCATGVVSTGLGQYFRYFLIRRKGPVFLAPNSYLAAMVTTVLGVGLLGEPVTISLSLGFAIILVGLFISEDGSGRMRQAD